MRRKRRTCAECKRRVVRLRWCWCHLEVCQSCWEECDSRKLGSSYMSHTITSRAEIPSARFYVLANDAFMSGWGEAEGKINTLVLPCTDWEEAKTVEANARARSEMRRIRITGSKPTLRPHVLYSLLNRERAERWYTPGGFAPEPVER